MSYNRLLMKIIAESGYTNKEIIEECNKRGRKIDKSYLSKLLNGKIQAPAEELSRMFADICNVDERRLVLEGYIDKAPKEIREAFLSIKKTLYMFTTSFFENKLQEDVLKQLEEKLEEEPLADFVISLIDEKPDDINFMENGIEMLKFDSEENIGINFNMRLEEPLALPVGDEGMFPKIIKNSKIISKVQKEYEDWDILAIKLKDKEEIIVRFALINNEEITLKPLNNQFETLKYNLRDITILGKVTKIITDI